MEQLWKIYHKEIPLFLQEFAGTPPMLRLKCVGMNCGCEYTRFPRFANLAPYSRYDHSVGVALIIWHFTADRAQALAGLFHDVTTPVFAHVVDFLNGDHLCQESTEAGVEARLRNDPDTMRLLHKYNLTVNQVADYQRYPVADKPGPALAADRLEYTLGNLLNYGFADLNQIRSFYEDLIVGADENGKPELMFRNPTLAAGFATAALKNSRVYVADEDRFAMETLAGLLKEALKRGVLTKMDLQTEEAAVIAKLRKDAACAKAWRKFCDYTDLQKRNVFPEETGWLCVDAKKRWIDPLAKEKGRVSLWNEEFRTQKEEFLARDFYYWLRGLTKAGEG